MNKFKFLLLVAAFFIATNIAHAGGSTPWCDSHVEVSAVKTDGTTGGGKVYATREASKQAVAYCANTVHNETLLGKSHDSSIFPSDLYLAAKPDEGWELDYWECKTRKGDYVDGATAIGEYHDWGIYPPLQKAGVSKMKGDPNNGASSDNVTPSGVINAVWVAHFKQAGTRTVKVLSENESLGTATIDKVTNSVGNEVTLSAWCGNSSSNPRSENIMFMGWYRLNESTGEKEFVSRDYNYSFTITEANKGTYYARYASGYYFWRIKNNKYGDYITAVKKYTGSVSSATAMQTALKTQLSLNSSLETSITDPGTIMKVWISGYQPNTHREVWDIYVQNEHTNQYYPEELVEEGTFLQVSHINDNTYYIHGNKGTAYLKEPQKGTIEATAMVVESAKWCFEGMDKDLTTKENYFAVAPSEFVGPDNDGYYWTTLRMCFNMKYETSEITPFIVTAADANAGTMELTEVTGGIIPEKTCVLLRCNSTDVTRNVMIPTTTAASFSPTGNMLTSSTYYYKNQSVNSSQNLKGIKLVDGRLGFGGSTKTSVDGNRAYLSIASNNDVAVPDDATSRTLAEMLAEGNTDRKYRVTDLTSVEAVGKVLYCKDDNGFPNKSMKLDGEIDFVKDYAGLQDGDWDQSNWIAVTLPDYPTTDMIGARLNNVIGHLTNTTNPEFIAEKMPNAGSANHYDLNTYITCNFVAEHQNNITLNNQLNNCFFVAPKPMEIAYVEWAMWDKDNNKFVKPTNAPSSLQGEFFANFTMLPSQPELVDGGGYHFIALIKNENANSSTLNGETPRVQSLVVYPMEWTVDTPTAIENVATSKVATNVTYYNMIGVASSTPHQGINIMVTDYSDGSRTAVKIMK